ncbi:MAG: glycosyltransferase [Rickettsiales bacterium]|nr:glycosyltransferase [Rickettsiales bacterium]
MPKVSVIVPVYNVEKYLRKCLDSIVNQTLHDIEIIIVNDGSTDGCLSIISAYAALDARIRVLDGPNYGYGKAVNRGIDAATGDFIGIVESDDFIEPDMYEELYELAIRHNAEIVKGSMVHHDDRTGTDVNIVLLPEKDAYKVIRPLDNPEIFYKEKTIWSAIYRRDFIRDNDIRCLESPGASYQDNSFNFKALASATRMYMTLHPVVHYRINSGTNSVASTGKIFCMCDEYAEIDRWLAQRPQLAAEARPIYIREKYAMYSWNFKRLENHPENQAIFKERFRQEFAELMPLIIFFEQHIKKIKDNLKALTED